MQQCTGATRQVLEPLAEVQGEVAGLLHGPLARRVGGHAQDVHVPGGHLHHEQDIEAFQGNRIHMEEVAGQQPLRLHTQDVDARHDVSTSGAAGLRRRARRIRRTVDALMR